MVPEEETQRSGLNWGVFQFLAVQISFPCIPHLLLKSSRALAFLLFSLITPWGSCLILPLQVGMWVLPVLEKTLSGVSVTGIEDSKVRGVCAGLSWPWVPLCWGPVALTAKPTYLCADVLLCWPCLSPSSISYHSTCDKSNNQAHVSLS